MARPTKAAAAKKVAATNGDDNKSVASEVSSKVMQPSANGANVSRKRRASSSVEQLQDEHDDASRPKREAKKPKRLGEEVPALAEHKVVKTSTKKAAAAKTTSRVKKTPAPAAAKKTAAKPAAKTVKTTKTTKETTAKVTKKTAEAKTKTKVTKKAAVTKTAGARRTKKALSPEAVEKALAEKPKPKPRRKAVVAEPVVEEQKPAVPRYIKPRTKPVREFTIRSDKKLSVFVTGSGDMGEIGLGPNVNMAKKPKLVPTLLPEEAGVVQVACGGMHSLCLTHDGKIYSWGVNDQGALGRDTEYEAPTRDADADSDSEDETDLNPLESTPGLVSGLPEDKQFVKVAAGDSISVAITEDGLVYGWGTFRSDEGILGFSETVDIAKRPVLIEGVQDAVDVACGVNHVLVLTRYGRVYAWGAGGQFQLGRRIVERRAKSGLTPSEVGLATKIVGIGAGSYHSFAIDEQDRVFAWGLNQFLQCGQLGPKQEYGEEDNTIISTPTIVDALTSKQVVQITAGEHHSVARCNDGTVLAWGRTDSNAVGLDFAKMDQDALYRNARGQPQFVKRPTVVEGIKASAITSGTNHCLAISSEDKGVYAWGYAESNQCGIVKTEYVETPQRVLYDDLANVAFEQIAAGGQFSIMAGVIADAKATETKTSE